MKYFMMTLAIAGLTAACGGGEAPGSGNDTGDAGGTDVGGADAGFDTSGDASTDISRSDVTIDVARPDWPDTDELDPAEDEDGDGLTNGDELAGYPILVNETGWPGANVEYNVISNPFEVDTDYDGLTDAEERAARTNPLVQDTDGDTLDDWEELRFWATSPVTVDTDGDSVGGLGTMPPNPALFDGAELNLRRDIIGLQAPGEPSANATSPRNADTDGDTVRDYDELILPTRSPVIAEVVEVQLVPSRRSEFEIALVAEYEDGTVDSNTFSTSLTFEEGITAEASTEVSTTTTNTNSSYVFQDISVDAGCCLTFYEMNVTVGWGAETSLRQEFGSTASFSSDVSFDMQNVESEASSASQSETVTLTGGVIRMSIDLLNSGSIAAQVADIAILVRYFDPETGNNRVLGELVPVDGQALSILAPGESTSIQVSNTDLPLDPVRQIMRDPHTLSFSIARYDLRDKDGQDFDFLYQDLPDRTASISIVRQGSVDHFYIAADVFTDAEGVRYGVSLADALTAYGMDFALRETAEGEFAVELDGILSQLHVRQAPDLQANGADRFGYPETGGPGERILRRGWVGLFQSRDPDHADEYYASFFDARVRPGDVITLLLDEDIDQDGIPALEEALYGSSDNLVHSDRRPGQDTGDGLSDYWEIREGWMVSPTEFVPYRAYSSPAFIDSDRDGITDDLEASFDGGFGTDPLRADTDGDGFSDYQEVYGEGDEFDPLRPNERTDPTVVCSYVIGDGCDRHFSIEIADAGGDLAVVALDLGDGSDPIMLSGDWVSGEAFEGTLETTQCFDGHPALVSGSVYIEDALGLAAYALCGRE